MKRRSRKSMRLEGYDYSTPGYYFITTNVHRSVTNRRRCFGTIKNGRMILNEWGKIAHECWHDLPNHYSNIQLDEFVIMPDHVHGIVVVVGVGVGVGVGLKPTPTPTPTTEIVRAFKTFSSRRINETKPDHPFRWQRSFHDRIIRNAGELNRIRYYIRQNPAAYGRV